MRERTIKVDLDVKEVKILKYKQYDHNLLLKIIVCENKQPIDLSNYNAKAFFELPDKTVIQRNLKINNSIIHITLEDIILSQSGKTSLEVTVSNETQIVTFFTLYLDVEKSINRNVAVEGEPTWDILKDASETIDKVKEIAEEVEDDINTMSTKVSNLETNVNLVNITVDEVNADIKKAQQNIDSINAELDSMGGNIGIVENVGKELNTIKSDLNNKVDKETGKSLISNEEILRLSTVDNYNDTEIKEKIRELETKEHSHDNKNVLDTITYNKLEEWNNKSGFDGNYNNLINKPTIPTKVSQLENDKNYLTSIPSEYVTENELNQKDYATQSWTIDKINQITPGSGNVNVDLSEYQTKVDNDLKTENKTVVGSINEILEELNSIETTPGENGITFIPNVDTDGNISWSNNGNLENPETINIKGEKGEDGIPGEKGADGKDGLTTSISVNNNVYTHVNGLITLPNYPNIPTKISQLENDKNYLTSIPNEYITETELGNKNYLTSIPSEYITDTELNQKGYATETYVQNKIAETQLNGSEVDLSGYATKDDLNNKADIKHTHEINDINDLQDKLNDKLEISDLSNYATKNELPSVPTKVSQLENDKNYLNSIPDEYITENELNQKGYLTEHQDLSDYITTEQMDTSINQKEDEITNAISKTYTTKIEFNNTIEKYYIKEEVDGYVNNLQDELNDKLEISDLNEYAKKSDIPSVPTKISQLENDKNYLTSIPNEYVTDEELNQKGYLTEHQDLSDYALKNDLNEKVDKINGKGLSTEDYTTEEKNKLNNIEENANNYVHPQKHNASMIEGLATVSTTGNYNDLTNKPTIPTKTSELLNDNGYLTSVPSEYITTTELNTSLSNYALKSEIPQTNSNETLTTLTISNRRLTLSTDKRQIVTMANNTTISLPSVSSFTEIHLYFSATSNYTITFPSVKWQKTPSVMSGKTYEFIFTYVNNSVGWLGGFIEYTN